MNTAIYTLPHTESLNLDYLTLDLVLKGLNSLNEKDVTRDELHKIASRKVGVSKRTIQRKISDHNLQFDNVDKKYCIMSDNPILKIANA